MNSKPDFDPDAIPNYVATGRTGELHANEPEQHQHSVQATQGTEAEVQAEPSSGVAGPDPDEAGRDDPVPPPPRARESPTGAGNNRTMRDDRARGERRIHDDSPEPLRRGPGGIDGLVGAP